MDDRAKPMTEKVEQPNVDDPAEKPTDQISMSSNTDAKLSTPKPSPEDDDYLTGFKLAVVIMAITFVAFLMMLDTSIIATAIPRITSDFHSLPNVGWYGSAYLVASCALQPLTGKIYTYFHSKRIFLTFFGIFELGSLLCGVATSSKMLIIGRAVAGMGSSGMMNGSLTIISASIPMTKRPMYIGFMVSVAQLGTVLGPLVGGALTQYTTWRWCFYINLPTGGLCAILLMLIGIPSRHIKFEPGPGKSRVLAFIKKMDLAGFAIFAPFAVQFLLPLQWGGTKYAWSDSRIIGLFCGSAATLCVFLAWEHHVGDDAMVPFSIIRRKVVWTSCLFMACFFGSLLIVSYYLPIYFQAAKGVSPTLSGVYLLPSILFQMLAAGVSGFLVGRLGYYLPWVIASGVLVSIGNGLLTLLTPTASTGAWVGYQIVVGIGRGCGFQMPIIAIQNNIPPAQTSVGMATLVFSQTFGGALFLALAETDFASSLTKALHTFAPAASPQAVIEAGALAFREAVAPKDLPGVLQAYTSALNHTFYLAMGCAMGMFIFSWGMGWKSVKKAKAAAPEA